MKLLTEAIIFALVITILAIIISCDMNQKLLLTVFLAGFIGHLGFEFLGINKWYCTHGNACQS